MTIAYQHSTMSSVAAGESTTCELLNLRPSTQLGGGADATDETLRHKVTSIACEILRVAHELNGFSEIYGNAETNQSQYKNEYLIKGFVQNSFEKELKFSKMQNTFNSLKGRVERLKGADPRIERVFNLMTEAGRSGIYNVTNNLGLETIRKGVEEIIGRENIVEDSVFKRHGVVCLRGDALPEGLGVNVVSEDLLKRMNELRDGLLDANEGYLDLTNNSSDFNEKVKFDMEKILTFPVGRELAKEIIDYGQNVRVNQGQSNSYYPNSGDGAPRYLDITLNNQVSNFFGYTEQEVVNIKLPAMTAIFHELIHRTDDMRGITYPQEIDKSNPWTNGAELRTIGDPRNRKIDPSTNKHYITENSLIENTEHLPRIYHLSPFSDYPDKGTFDSVMKRTEMIGYKEGLVTYIKENEEYLLGEDICRALTYFIETNSIDHINNLLNLPKIVDFLKEGEELLLYGISDLAIKMEHAGILEKMIQLFSDEIALVDAGEKYRLIIDTLRVDLNIITAFKDSEILDEGVKLEVLKDLSSIVRESPLTAEGRRKIDAILRCKGDFGITDEDLVQFQRDESMNPEIRILFNV